MSALPFGLKLDPRWCPECWGAGRTFGCLTVDPSERPKWRDCDACDGTGEKPRKEEDDGDDQHTDH